MIWKRQDFSGSISESSSPQKFVHNDIFLTKPKFEISFSQNCSWCVETTHKQHGASLAAPRTVFWTLPHRRLHIFSKGEHNFEKRTLFVLRLRVYEESLKKVRGSLHTVPPILSDHTARERRFPLPVLPFSTKTITKTHFSKLCSPFEKM